MKAGYSASSWVVGLGLGSPCRLHGRVAALKTQAPVGEKAPQSARGSAVLVGLDVGGMIRGNEFVGRVG